MMGRSATWFCVVTMAMLIAACDVDDGPVELEDDDLEFREVYDNGTWLNGTWLNGTWLNGSNLGGIKLKGNDPAKEYVEVVGMVGPKGHALQSQHLVDGELRVEEDGVEVGGKHVQNTKIQYEIGETVSGVKPKEIKVKEVHLDDHTGLWIYKLEIREDGPWQPLCRDANNKVTTTLLLDDVWEGTTGDRTAPQAGNLTFACRGTALAKCVELGYRPWSSVNGMSLREIHQACTRMIRADYCGDGQTHTVNGTPIHVLDTLGIQKVAPGVTYAVEAEWGVDGAVCLNQGNTRLANPPPIACGLPACGESFASGALLQSGKILSGP